MNSYLDKISKNPVFLSICGVSLIFLLVSFSLGQTSRWDLLEHIQMADRFEIMKSIYPNYNDETLTGVSVYFPGLTFIAVLLKKIFQDNCLIITMQFLACSFIVIFFFLQHYISKSFIENLTFSFYFWTSSIAIVYLNIEWLIYASEFKPDTIAYCVGSLGIILSGIDKQIKKSKFLFVFGIFLTGSGIIFKQQYIFFLLGMIIFAVFKKDITTRIFVFFSVLVSVFIILMIRFDYNTWCWTVTVLKDDGLIPFKTWIIDQKGIFLRYFRYALILFLFWILKLLYLPKGILFFISSKIKNNIWLLIMIFVSLGSFFSSFKVGGNAGNTAFGLIIVLPFFLYFIQFLEIKFLSIFLCLFIIFKVPRLIFQGSKRYLDSIELSDMSKYIVKSKNIKILTGSDTYSATRCVRDSNIIVNYWSYSLRENSDVSNQLKIIANNSNFDYLIIENWASNREFLRKSKKFEILFINNIGIIAKSSHNKKEKMFYK